MDETIKDAINAMGAVTEIAGFMFNQFLKQGFKRNEALELTKEVVRSLLPNNPGDKHDEG